MELASGASYFVISFALDPNPPSVGFDHSFGDGQAQARSSSLETRLARAVQRGITEPIEFVKDVFLFFWVNADAGVGHYDFHEIGANALLVR